MCLFNICSSPEQKYFAGKDHSSFIFPRTSRDGIRLCHLLSVCHPRLSVSFFILLCALKGGLCPDSQAPLPSGFWFSLDSEQYHPDQKIAVEGSRALSFPFLTWSACVHPGWQLRSCRPLHIFLTLDLTYILVLNFCCCDPLALTS